ncbi:PspC domain-containing protein [Thalassotalea sp. 1_MG-2023]|uniref:PspC domain-containing protein n=1 Tax=Thalassotalea sp. 1_MG-2023 TaxID=3062680 RepID=UPI0026E287B1|nr:PspC domain-containing protein [Thalassotalea sp. 1_MG-2023]MDO6426255.1 PspC domain-containing protein [Thalassotalea sp. 1_MG-2023]
MKYQRQYTHKSTLSKDQLYKKVSGVCAGIARHYQFPRWGVRIAAIVSLFAFPVVTAVAYICATILLPNHY